MNAHTFTQIELHLNGRSVKEIVKNEKLEEL